MCTHMVWSEATRITTESKERPPDLINSEHILHINIYCFRFIFDDFSFSLFIFFPLSLLAIGRDGERSFKVYTADEMFNTVILPEYDHVVDAAMS